MPTPRAFTTGITAQDDSSDIAISVQNVSKAYRIWGNPVARLTSPILAGTARLLPGPPAQWLKAKAAKNYRDFWALKDISFQIRKGEAVGIIGRNGSGKSTLLQIIAGTLQPTAGTVAVNGRVAALLELGSGFNPEFTGRENVYLNATILGLTRPEIDAAFTSITAFADIGDFIDQPVKIYSSGMMVRLAFAVATAAQPDILIVDEALSVGDAYFQAKCHERIAQYRKRGMSLLLVTHATEDLVKRCDRAIFLRRSKMEMDGAPREVTNLYLDDLFGRQGPKDPATSHEATALSIMATEQNVFHTRPGYRKEEHRWGHGGAQILDFLVVSEGQEFPHQIISNVPADFYFKVRFEKAHLKIVPGFLIKTIEGIILYGTNSFHSTRGQASISAEAGETLLFKFTLPVALNSGHYLISFGVSEQDASEQLTPLDRRYDSLLIAVSREVPFWGIADLKASFELVARG